jgi:hypothetical protein
MVLERGHFGKQIQNTLKALKCEAGKGWRSGGQMCEKCRSIM